jgi:hypothetical protein
MTYRPSIEERIAWTPGLSPVEVKVLQALARFADYTTGANARPSWQKLVAWSELSRRTVARGLRQLEQHGWIVVTARRHRHPTTYRIRLERLATSPTRAKQVVKATPPEPGVECQPDTQHGAILGANLAPLECQPDTQDPSALGANLALHPVSGTPSQYPGTPPQQIPLTMEVTNPEPRIPTPRTSTAAADVWTDVLRHIEPKVNRHTFATWWGPSVLVEDQGSVLLVRANNQREQHELAVHWIQKHFAAVLAEALAAVRPGARVEWRFAVRHPPQERKFG